MPVVQTGNDRVVVVREGSGITATPTSTPVVVTNRDRVAVAAPGPQGPPGPVGPPGGAYLTHHQFTPASTWTIPHNLGRYVQVLLLDESGVEYFADVEQSTTQVSVTHPAPTAGYALLS